MKSHFNYEVLVGKKSYLCFLAIWIDVIFLDGSMANNLKYAALPLYAKGQCGAASKPIEAGFQPAYEAKKHAKYVITNIYQDLLQ